MPSLLARRFHEAAQGTMVRRGSGKSGIIEIEAPGQEVLAQTAVIVGDDGTVEARFPDRATGTGAASTRA